MHQEPAPGTPLAERTMVKVRTARMDLDEFRGPCDPEHGSFGPLTGPDAALARQFYRFAADPSLGAAFANEVWIGIGNGPTSTTLSGEQLTDLEAWQVGHEGYAESTGPFSALDLLAHSGGYYEVHEGVMPTCGFGRDKAPPPELAGLRAISLTAPDDVTMACMDWWGVTLHLDAQDRIRGVALRLGSP